MHVFSPMKPKSELEVRYYAHELNCTVYTHIYANTSNISFVSNFWSYPIPTHFNGYFNLAAFHVPQIINRYLHSFELIWLHIIRTVEKSRVPLFLVFVRRWFYLFQPFLQSCYKLWLNNFSTPGASVYNRNRKCMNASDIRRLTIPVRTRPFRIHWVTKNGNIYTFFARCSTRFSWSSEKHTLLKVNISHSINTEIWADHFEFSIFFFLLSFLFCVCHILFCYFVRLWNSSVWWL